MTNTSSGYMGQILHIDLDSFKSNSIRLKDEEKNLFIGGRGLGIGLLMDHFLSLKTKYTDPFKEIHPLSPDNPLIFTVSPMTGTLVPSSARCHLSFKSPLTGGVGSSNSGGKWGVEFKRTGYDALAITGCAQEPVVLFIDNGKVVFDTKPISDPNNVEKITAELIDRYGKKVKVMTVGVSGRRLSPIAAVINDNGRAFGRGGGGAVFGSKNIIAIAVSGQKAIKCAFPEMLRPNNISGSVFKALVKIRMGKLTKPPEQFGILPALGTNGLMGMLAQYDELVHKNFQDNCHDPENLGRINGEGLAGHTHIQVKRRSCFNCPIGCTRYTRILYDSEKREEKGEGPEFETAAMLGANLDVYDLIPITEANYRCNQYGLDTISVGSTLAALMELYSLVRSLSVSEQTAEEQLLMQDLKLFMAEHGEPVFGSKNCLVPLVEATAFGTGIGEFTSKGAQRLAERYGHPEIAMTVKGMEIPAYDPRATWTQALSYMISPRGGCHLQGGYSAPLAFCAGYGEFPGTKSEGAALVARNASYHNCAYDILGVCAFSGFSITLDEFANMLNDVTGWDYKASDIESTARRILTMERLFNLACDFKKEDDWLPDRFFDQPILVNGKKEVCARTEFQRMRKEYYEAMGWDDNGIPKKVVLEQLCIEKYWI